VKLSEFRDEEGIGDRGESLPWIQSTGIVHHRPEELLTVDLGDWWNFGWEGVFGSDRVVEISPKSRIMEVGGEALEPGGV
jgi:hypothetical protein